MHTWRARTRATGLAVLIAIGLVATACFSDGGEGASLPPTPDREVPGLLPPTAETTAPTVEPTAQQSTDLQTPTNDVAATSTLDCLSMRNRAALLLMPLLEQPELESAQALAAVGDLGGLVLLGTPNSDLAADLARLQEASKFASILVASDEEGGSVQRLDELLGPLPSAATSATTSTPEEVQRLFTEYGSRARALGVHVIFGPVVDVGSGPGIEGRSFGDDPQVVIAFGRAVADGLREAGVMPVFKHFPGHGRATADSHLLLPTTPSIDELRQRDLVPYVELLADPSTHGEVAVMVGHLAVPGLSGDLPTSLSPEAIQGVLRGELGFTGLVFTDALNMAAIVDTYGPLDAIERSISAGADLAILGSLNDVGPALDHLVSMAEANPVFGEVLENRAMRVLIARGEGDLCQGAR